jgi:hypothetical protein
MKIGREEWQAELRERIKISLPRLKRVGITSGYTIIAASAMLPVVIAGAGWLTALASMVGSVGANLISNRIQGAKDDIDLANRLQNLPSDDQVHQYIQLLLEKLDAVNVARQGLSESDWARLEQILDSRLSYLGGHIYEKVIEAPEILEKVSGAQARIIARKSLRKTWWLKKGQQNLNANLQLWPMAYYKTRYTVKYQETKREQIKNEKGEIVNTVEREKQGTTSPIDVGIIVYPDTIITRGANELQQRVFAGLNNFQSNEDIMWGSKSVAQFVYDSIYYPLWKSFRTLLKSPKIKVAEKKIKYWKNPSDYLTKPGYLSISEDQLIEDARKFTQQELAYYYNNLSNTTFLGAEYGQESIRCARYPFWIIEASAPNICTLVIDGLTGKILFVRAYANRLTEAIVAGTAIFVVIVLISIFAYFFIPLFR